MVGLLGLGGCSSTGPTPDQIRRNTAKATAAAARDTKAVAQGVFDGLKSTARRVNINDASKLRLETLPGIDSAAADSIIAGRPYKSSTDLLRRHIVTHAEYERIAGKIEAR